jgi:guanylate kinase
MTAAGRLFVVSAPSGAGKSTLVRRLLATLPRLRFSVSWTTRAPRAGEEHGVAYWFTDAETFRAKAARGEFLEWAEVHGRLYGTARHETEERLAAGDDLILDIDVQGAEQVRASGLPAVSVFILPPSRAELELRLQLRATEGRESLAERMATAAAEVARYGEFEYLVVNDDLDRAAEDLASIVRAARCARGRQEAAARQIAAMFAAGGNDR